MTNLHLGRALCLLVAIISLSACIQTKPVPGYARSGDHIVIGLGGIERNAGASQLRAADLTITLTDSDSTSFNLQPRMLFKSYPDYSALVNTMSLDGSMASTGLPGMVPYDGGWFVLVPLTEYGEYDLPLPLATGQATVEVTSPKLTNTYSDGSSEGNLASLNLEILPGTSAQDIDFVRQFTAYVDSGAGFLLSPVDAEQFYTGEPSNAIVGAFIVVDYVDLPGTNPELPGVASISVVPAQHGPHTQLDYALAPNGDGTGKVRIKVLNTNGFYPSDLLSESPQVLGIAPIARLKDLNLRLNYHDSMNVTQAKSRFSLNTAESYFIDQSGQRIDGLTLQMVHISDL